MGTHNLESGAESDLDPLSDLGFQFRLLREFVHPMHMPQWRRIDGDHVLCEFIDCVAMQAFLTTIASYACEHSGLLRYLKHEVHLNVILRLDDSDCCHTRGLVHVRPTLQLSVAAVTALALAVAFDNWFADGQDRVSLIPR